MEKDFEEEIAQAIERYANKNSIDKAVVTAAIEALVKGGLTPAGAFARYKSDNKNVAVECIIYLHSLGEAVDTVSKKDGSPLSFARHGAFFHSGGEGDDENWESVDFTLWNEQIKKGSEMQEAVGYHFVGYYDKNRGQLRLAQEEDIYIKEDIATPFTTILEGFAQSPEPTENTDNVLSILGPNVFFSGHIGRPINSNDSHGAEISTLDGEPITVWFNDFEVTDEDIGKLLLVYGYAKQKEDRDPTITAKKAWLF